MSMFERTELLLGTEVFSTLKNKRVILFGLGGVGGHAGETLVRTGIKVTAIDNGVLKESNINRQILATANTIGRQKTDAFIERMLSINPSADITAHSVFINNETICDIDLNADYCIDAIDTLTGKLAIIRACADKNLPIISCMGTGNKVDPTGFKYADIFQTKGCPVAKRMRTELRKIGITSLDVVYSDEEPSKTVMHEYGRHAPASISYMPAIAGLMLAGYVIKRLADIGK